MGRDKHDGRDTMRTFFNENVQQAAHYSSWVEVCYVQLSSCCCTAGDAWETDESVCWSPGAYCHWQRACPSSVRLSARPQARVTWLASRPITARREVCWSSTQRCGSAGQHGRGIQHTVVVGWISVTCCEITTRNCSSHIDMHTHAGSAFDHHMILTFDLLTLGSLHAERLPCTVCVPSLVLIVRVIFLLERGHTQRQSQMPLITQATASASVGDKWANASLFCFSSPFPPIFSSFFPLLSSLLSPLLHPVIFFSLSWGC